MTTPEKWKNTGNGSVARLVKVSVLSISIYLPIAQFEMKNIGFHEKIQNEVYNGWLELDEILGHQVNFT